MTDLQNYLDHYGFRISIKELRNECYNEMRRLGHKVSLLNERYIIVDGQSYYFSKSRKHGRWIAKEF